MTEAPPPGRIVVFNTLLAGISDGAAVPTILLHIHGMPPAKVESEAAEVGMLQAVAPSFRVVLFTEFPVFNTVRRFGWPVEHVPPPEHHTRIAGDASHQRYVEQRIRIAQEHYRDMVVVHADGTSSAAGRIAALIGRPELAALVRTLTAEEPAESAGNSRWDAVVQRLRTAGTADFTSAEGRARISCADSLRGSVLITGSSPGDSASHHSLELSWMSSIEVEFHPDSSLAFESHVYASLSRVLGDKLAIVHPWRRLALLSDDVLHWADLAIEDTASGLRVLEEFLEMYEMLTGSAMLDWYQARRYAAARRLSRTASRRRAAP